MRADHVAPDHTTACRALPPAERDARVRPSTTRGNAAQVRANPWARIKPWLWAAFFVVVAALLARLARGVDWAMAWQSMRSYRPSTLLLAAALCGASYAVYCSYDLFGRHQTGHRLPAARVVAVGFVSYAFNLNLGSLVGGVAMRYRLYSRLGLDPIVTTEILGLSVLTNWLGYFLVSGLVFVLQPLPLAPDSQIGSNGLRFLGSAMLCLAVAYVSLCARSSRREWTLRKHMLVLPTGRVALLQLAASSVNWLLIAGVAFVLLRGRIDYASVLSVMLIAAMAGVISHIPAGLGVLEAVFLSLLSARAPPSELVAALLTYRGLYYVAPLALAALYFLLTGGGAQLTRSEAEDAGTAGAH